VVDCGTAITVDAVTAAGRFLGGSIAPGVRAMARGLAACAPRLPAVGLDAPLRPLASSTEEAVRSGLAHAFCGAVERLVAEVCSCAGLERAPLLLTGGDAELYLRHGRLEFRHVPDLVHRGLRHLWAERGDGP
jgi:type III pantothenate kinase